MLFFMDKPLNVIAALALIVSLSACGKSPEARAALAGKISGDRLPIHTLVDGGEFKLESYARVTEENKPARVYIEGDGLAWLGRHEPSPNPTPTNPVALKLAVRDPSPNVVWLGRPCQYGGYFTGCSSDYWTSKRFAPEVIFAYKEALDEMVRKYRFSTLELVGFSGGGAIAALIAADRSDVANLRTVAGNLDHDAFNRHHGVSLMPASLNARDVALKLSRRLPQRHFTGAKDDVIPESVYASYAMGSGDRQCLHHDVITGASHEKGWEDIWPRLLSKPVICLP